MSVPPDPPPHPADVIAPAPVGFPVVILGASVRSAAHSARRAGWLPLAADAYADSDLLTHARLLPVQQFPHSLPADLAPLPATPWLYTGGLENDPPLLAQLAQWGPLWGNSAAIVNRVRDPDWLHQTLKQHALPTPELRPADKPPPADGSWMLKPRFGAAGRGVVPWTTPHATHPTRSEPHLFQRRVSGRAGSGLFLAEPDTTHCLGLTWQLATPAGHPWPHAWSGNLLPVESPPRLSEPLARAGLVLARAAGLRGLFGIDFLDDGHTPWLLEVNPRYTGSTELFEYRSQTPWLCRHARACAPQTPLPAPLAVDAPPLPRTHCLGKAIVYATSRSRLTRSLAPGHPTPDWELPKIADIPAPGQLFSPGDPVCTVFGHAPSETDCLAQLAERVAQILDTLTRL